MRRFLLLSLLACAVPAAFAQNPVLYRQMGLNLDYISVSKSSVPSVSALFDFAFQNEIGGLPVALMGGFGIGGGFSTQAETAVVAYIGHADVRVGVQLPVPALDVAVAVGYGTHRIDGDVPVQEATGPLVEGRANVGPFRLQARTVLSSPGYLGLTGLYSLPDGFPLLGSTYVGAVVQRTGSATVVGGTLRALL